MHQHSNYRSPKRRREKKRVWENFWRDYSWKFPNKEKEIVNQVQEAQIVQKYRINPRKNMPIHISIKLTKTKHKEKILKASSEEQQVTYRGNPICLTADLSAEILQTSREWQDTFKVLKGKNLQPRLLYPARISWKIDRKIKKLFR